jgi:hypothetical protein
MKFFQIFKDENGHWSSNRFVGIVCAIFLCATMYHNSFSEEHVAPSAILVECVTALAFGALGLGAANKIFKKKEDASQEG